MLLSRFQNTLSFFLIPPKHFLSSEKDAETFEGGCPVAHTMMPNVNETNGFLAFWNIIGFRGAASNFRKSLERLHAVRVPPKCSNPEQTYGFANI